MKIKNITRVKTYIIAFFEAMQIKNKRKKIHTAFKYLSIPLAAIMAAYTAFIIIYTVTNFFADNYIQLPIRIYFVDLFVPKAKTSVNCGKNTIVVVQSAKNYLLNTGDCVEATKTSHIVITPYQNKQNNNLKNITNSNK